MFFRSQNQLQRLSLYLPSKPSDKMNTGRLMAFSFSCHSRIMSMPGLCSMRCLLTVMSMAFTVASATAVTRCLSSVGELGT